MLKLKEQHVALPEYSEHRDMWCEVQVQTTGIRAEFGGALGGVFVGFIAPRLFPTYYEFGIGLIVTLLVVRPGGLFGQPVRA